MEGSGSCLPRIAPIDQLRCFAFYGKTLMMLSAMILKQFGLVTNKKLWSNLLTKRTFRLSNSFVNSLVHRKEILSCILVKASLPLGTAHTLKVELYRKLSEKIRLSKQLTSSLMSLRKNTSFSKAICGNLISVHLRE